MKLIKIFILILLSLYWTSAEELIQKYDYYELQECTIPITKDMKLIDHNPTKMSYFFHSTESMPSGWASRLLYVHVFVNDKHKESVVKKLNKALTEDFIIKSEKTIFGFDIWSYQYYRNKKATGKTNIVFLPQSVLSMDSYDENELKYMLEYCKKTRK